MPWNNWTSGNGLPGGLPPGPLVSGLNVTSGSPTGAIGDWIRIRGPVLDTIEQLLAEIWMSDFGVFNLESDIQARHHALLREHLTPNWEVLTQLDTAGSRGRKKHCRPDLSVLRRYGDPWADRAGLKRGRKSVPKRNAVFSAEYKYCSPKTAPGLENQFDILVRE